MQIDTSFRQWEAPAAPGPAASRRASRPGVTQRARRWSLPPAAAPPPRQWADLGPASCPSGQPGRYCANGL